MKLVNIDYIPGKELEVLETLLRRIQARAAAWTEEK